MRSHVHENTCLFGSLSPFSICRAGWRAVVWLSCFPGSHTVLENPLYRDPETGPRLQASQRGAPGEAVSNSVNRRWLSPPRSPLGMCPRIQIGLVALHVCPRSLLTSSALLPFYFHFYHLSSNGREVVTQFVKRWVVRSQMLRLACSL